MMVMESGFSSPRRADSFPTGLRVLVVDDDPTWLKILEKMLKKCSYEVTTCGLAREALKLLRERKDGFDIVISDVNMPDMDGFKLLEHVGLEMDLPVIMMSVDGETSRVMKGVQHGACDYLLKPIRMKELKNIWQHVFRKRMHEIRDIESHECFEDTLLYRHGMELYDDGHFLGSGDQFSIKKRKDIENKHDDKDSSDSSSTKKPRVMWSVDLHQKFVKAVNQIGFDKVGPKKILDLMNVPWLTRENVASHLQKYRLYLSRLQKENELKYSSGRSKKSDHPPKDTGNLSMQSSCGGAMQQSDGSIGNLQFPDYKLQFQNTDIKSNEVDPKSINVLPSAEPKNPLNSDNLSDPHEATISKMTLDHSFGSTPENKINYAPVDLSRDAPYPWGTSGQVSDPPFEFHFEPCQQVFNLKFVSECKRLNQLDCSFDYPSVHVPQKNIRADIIQPVAATSSRQSSLCEGDKWGSIESQLSSVQNSNNNIKQPFSVGRNESFFQPKSCVLSPQVSEFSSNTSLDLRSNNSLIQNGLAGFELGQINQVLGCCEPAFGSLTDDLSLCWFQGDNFASNPGFSNTGLFSDYSFPELIHEAPICLHGLPRFDLDYLYDPMEYPVIDQGLFIS